MNFFPKKPCKFLVFLPKGNSACGREVTTPTTVPTRQTWTASSPPSLTPQLTTGYLQFLCRPRHLHSVEVISRQIHAVIALAPLVMNLDAFVPTTRKHIYTMIIVCWAILIAPYSASTNFLQFISQPNLKISIDESNFKTLR